MLNMLPLSEQLLVRHAGGDMSITVLFGISEIKFSERQKPSTE